MFLAFLGTRPNTEGLTVLITKEPYGSDLMKLPIDVFAAMMAAAQEVNKLLIRAFPDCDRAGIAADGFGVPHAHLKMYPLHGTRDPATGSLIVIKSQSQVEYPKYPRYLVTNDAELATPTHLLEEATRIRAAAW